MAAPISAVHHTDTAADPCVALRTDLHRVFAADLPPIGLASPPPLNARASLLQRELDRLHESHRQLRELLLEVLDALAPHRPEVVDLARSVYLRQVLK